MKAPKNKSKREVQPAPTSRPQPRTHKLQICFNDREITFIDNYCAKYRVENRSALLREAIISTLLKRLDQDGPTLF